jgi:hypothetical protein
MIDLRLLTSAKVIAGAIAVALILLLLTIAWIEWTAPAPPDPNASIAALTVIAAPSSTIAVVPTIPLTFGTPTPTFTPPPNTMAIGIFVQIKGTEGQGLRIRSTFGLDGQQLFLGYDSEVFVIKDGPMLKDGYTWWFIAAPYDEQRAGWAAADFLSVVPTP